MPTLQQLRYLVAIADTGHFRRAAERCHVTQPTLSVQLKQLEAKLKAVLVERGASRVHLTAFGEKVVSHARAALNEVEEIRTLSRLEGGSLSSTIRVGVVQSLGSYLMPLLVPDLHQSHPQLKLYIREGLPAHLLTGLRDASLDVLFFPLPVPDADFETLPLFREPLSVVVATDHPFAGETSVRADMLKGETIMALEPGHRLNEQVERICEQYGAHVSNDFAGTSLDTLRQMVAMGMGVSLLPALYVKSEVATQNLVAALPFRGTAPSRTVGMVWRRSTALDGEYRELGREIREILRAQVKEVTILG
ncbi:MAG: LysR substrate-binding domain-containing protein [Pseudomonadota bacterium]